jgi:phosphoenolpyruvate carboxylase
MRASMVQSAFIQKLKADRQFILDCYVEMLRSIHALDVIDLIRENQVPEPQGLARDKTVQALSIYFQLMTLVEENAMTKYRQSLVNHGQAKTIRGSWAETMQQWKDQGIREEEMLKTMGKIQVRPVLTAHPTEAKRVTVIEIHRELYLLLASRENVSLSKLEQHSIREKIIHLLERWWRTGEIYLEKPRVQDERSNVLYYLKNIFPLVLEKSDALLRATWVEMGFQAHKMNQPGVYPKITFGSWVGGDRDGHPLVTPDITEETLCIHRRESLLLLRKSLLDALLKCSISAMGNPVPESLS